MDNFVNLTAKGNVAVIVPLYGYWNDIQDNPVNGEVLDTVLKRVYSHVHNLYIIFVANPQTIENDPSNPFSVLNVLTAKSQAGNTKNLPVPRNATYNEYIKEGMEFALQETNSQFIVILNPWVMIQEGGIDAIVDRSNRADDAKIVSGYNVRPFITQDNFQAFDQFKTVVPKEDWDINFDFMAMPRYVAEMIPFEPGYSTHPFLQVDIFQAMRAKGFACITSQQMPIFPFDFPWTDYETKEMFEADRAFFVHKFGFDPGLTYGQEK